MASAITIFEDGTVSTVGIDMGNALHFARLLALAQNNLLGAYTDGLKQEEEGQGKENDENSA